MQSPELLVSTRYSFHHCDTWTAQGPGRFKSHYPEDKWVFPKIGVPQNGWFIMENPIKMDDLGVPPFSETLKWCVLFFFSF